MRRKWLKLVRGSQRNKSRSQAGEDKILDFLFSTMGIGKISYIDIGANHPIDYNNTFLFYAKGCSGVLVEPDPAFGKTIKDARPGDIILQAAITDTGSGTADFYIFDEPAINTLSKAEADIRLQSGKHQLKEVRQIDLLTIETIIEKKLGGKLPHLISLDVEGVDEAVLKAFDFKKYPVPAWVVETCEYSETHIKPKIHSIIDLMLSRGYFIYADTYINTIFVHKDWFYNHPTGR